MRRAVMSFISAFVAVILAVSCALVGYASRRSVSYPAGYVIYHQSFSDVTTPETAGVRKGSAGADGFGMSVSDGFLKIDSYDDRRSYVIFPQTDSLETYTVEFTFRFSRTDASNGYIGFMLTCSGDAPDNITSANVRVDGKCGDFGMLPDLLKNRLGRGELVTVTIPVKDRTLYQMTVSSGQTKQTLSIENVVDIVNGGFGFVTRNASVEISEVYIVNGVDYETKIGSLSNASSWSDDFPYGEAGTVANDAASESATGGTSDEAVNTPAPQTDDRLTMLVATAVLAGSAAMFGKNRKKRI